MADSTLINCRGVDNTGGRFGHCAVRVINEETGRDITMELIPSTVLGSGAFGLMNTIHAYGPAGDLFSAYGSNWSRVAVPAGMTSQQFDQAVLSSAQRVTGTMAGRAYTPTGGGNSNRFIYEIITGAGGTIPGGLESGFPFGAPGLCGGTGVESGCY